MKQKREELIIKIQNILAEDVPQIPLYYPADYYVYRADRYNGWIFMFDHHSPSHSLLSYLKKGMILSEKKEEI